MHASTLGESGAGQDKPRPSRQDPGSQETDRTHKQAQEYVLGFVL